jgi:succinoglycan biosynthesis transport protein ExoP
MNDDSGSEVEARGRDQAIDLSRLVKGIKRRWLWVSAPTLAAVAFSSGFVLLATPRYTGVAKVLLEDHESYYTRPDKATGYDPAATIDLEAVQSQAETVATVDLARQAIDRLGLAANPEFSASASSRPDGKVDQRVVDKFLSRLTVFPVPRTRVLEIEFVSRDPELAARGANTVAEVYLQSLAEAKANAARRAGAWLSRKIEELRVKVADDDAKVEAFRSQAGLLAGASGQTVPAQQLFDLNAQLANARSAQAAARAKAELLRKLEKEGRLDDAPDSITDQSMRRFAEQRVALKSQIAEAARTLLPMHPRMKELTAQLASLDGQIRDAAAKNVRALENDARLAGDQVETLTATLAQQSKTVATGNADDVQLRALDLEATAAREQLESYLQKYREAAARESDSAAPADARVIATAAPPRTPTFPKAWQTILLATLAALSISTGVAAASALLSNEADASAARGGPSSDHAKSPSTPAWHASRGADPPPPEPEPRAAPDPALNRNHEFSAADPIDALGDRLVRARTPGCGQVVLVTGQRCGQTLTIALETARRLSSRHSTLLVDLGATQEWFTDILDRERAGEVEVAGLADLLAGRANFGDIIRRDLSSGVDVIPSGGDPSGVEALRDVFDALASAYESIVIHASDWRTEAARTARKCADAIVVAAPEARLDRALDASREALGGVASEFIPFAVKPPHSVFEAAA